MYVCAIWIDLIKSIGIYIQAPEKVLLVVMAGQRADYRTYCGHKYMYIPRNLHTDIHRYGWTDGQR